MNIPPVHLRSDLAEVTRFRTEARRYPLGEAPPASADGDPIGAVKAILDWLDVERSPRYRSGAHSTYCNVYAHDFCFLLGVYLPRVWWSARSIGLITEGVPVDVQAVESVEEMTANALYEWLSEWGFSYGWFKVDDLCKAQEAANAGDIVLSAAKSKRPGDHGHISLIIPEEPGRPAVQGRKEFFPAQSQAGSSNYRYFIGNWWSRSSYIASGVWRAPAATTAANLIELSA